MRKRLTSSSAAWLLAAAALAAASAARADMTATRELMDSVPVERGKPIRVVVDNVVGAVHITAHDGRTVDMKATETIHGDTQSDLDRARKEVGLRTERSDDQVAFLVRRLDGAGQPCDCTWRRWDGYRVEYRIEIAVPRDATLDLASVNGSIDVDGVHGDFAVSSVNGAVRLEGLRGSGKVSTVNGELVAAFDKAPANPSSFKTVNGKIEVSLPRDLAADLTFKTLHGEIYTDYETTPLPLPATAESRRKDGFTVIRSDRRSGVRVGKGGPLYTFETLNGEIYVRGARR